MLIVAAYDIFLNIMMIRVSPFFPALRSRRPGEGARGATKESYSDYDL